MRNYLKLEIIVFTLIMFFISCENESEIIPKTGEPFARGNTVKFYYSNGSGVDLLNLKNNVILPVSFEDTVPIVERPSLNDTLYYYYDGGVIKFDSELERYYWLTPIYGKQGYEKHQFYVKISETDIDTFDVEFSYTTEDIVGADFYAYIDKLFYNGTLIMQEIVGDNGREYSNDKIFIQKDNGKTIISFDSY